MTDLYTITLECDLDHEQKSALEDFFRKNFRLLKYVDSLVTVALVQKVKKSGVDLIDSDKGTSCKNDRRTKLERPTIPTQWGRRLTTGTNCVDSTLHYQTRQGLMEAKKKRKSYKLDLEIERTCPSCREQRRKRGNKVK